MGTTAPPPAPPTTNVGPGTPDLGAAQNAAAASKAYNDRAAAARKKQADIKAANDAKAKASAPKKKAAPKAPLTATQKWLAGDDTYQQQLAEFNKSQSDYTTNYNTQKSQTNRDYSNTKRQMNIQGQKDRTNQQEDFGGRGILHSGVFAKALADYNTDYNTQMANLTTGLTDKLNDLSTQRKQYNSSVTLQKNSAKQDAIRRRAQTLGL